MTEPKILTLDEVAALEKGWGDRKTYPNLAIRVRDRDMTQDVRNLCATVRALTVNAKPASAKPSFAPEKPRLAVPVDEPPAPAKSKRSRKKNKGD
jgi:hypothetical protein